MGKKSEVLDWEALQADFLRGGFFSSATDFARKAGVAPITLRKIRQGEPVALGPVNRMVTAINQARHNAAKKGGPQLPDVKRQDWYPDQSFPQQQSHLSEGPINLRGDWIIEAKDIEVPEHAPLTYAQGPLSLTIRLTVEQDGRKLSASGFDQDYVPMDAWNAEFSQDWKYISGQHAFSNEAGYFTGVFFLRYWGKNGMTGYYLQQGTEHQTHFVFGELVMRRVED